MKAQWSQEWKGSKQPRKQRKYRYNAPKHTRRRFVSAHLDKKLREKTGKRAVSLRRGDEVKIMRGKRRGIKGKVDTINLISGRVFVEGQTRETVAGNKVPLSVEPSNLLVLSLAGGDKRRFKSEKARTAMREEKMAPKKEKPKVEEKEEKAKKKEETPKAEKKEEPKVEKTEEKS